MHPARLRSDLHCSWDCYNKRQAELSSYSQKKCGRTYRIANCCKASKAPGTIIVRRFSVNDLFSELIESSEECTCDREQHGQHRRGVQRSIVEFCNADLIQVTEKRSSKLDSAWQHKTKQRGQGRLVYQEREYGIPKRNRSQIPERRWTAEVGVFEISHKQDNQTPQPWEYDRIQFRQKWLAMHAPLGTKRQDDWKGLFVSSMHKQITQLHAEKEYSRIKPHKEVVAAVPKSNFVSLPGSYRWKR